MFQPFGELPNLARIRKPFQATTMRVPIMAIAYGILVNSDLVKPQDEPKRWADLADPKWKGKILADDVRALGGGSAFFFVMQNTYGRGFHEKLAANDLNWTRNLQDAMLRIGRGEYPIWVPQAINNFPPLKGLPVRFVIPEDGYFYVSYEVAMLKNAPHPNAARLMMDFFLSDESQLIHANAGNITVAQDFTEKPSDPDLAHLVAGKLLGTTEYSQQDAMLELAQQIYK